MPGRLKATIGRNGKAGSYLSECRLSIKEGLCPACLAGS